ncbi:MAG: hypothetical protein WA324_23980, partial [Bryobacteraceae bacterium]
MFVKIKRKLRLAVCMSTIAPLLLSAPQDKAHDKAIDIRRSTITIHVGKAGLFSAAGHEHLVSAPISSGVLNDSAQPSVEFKVDAAKMTVMPDAGVDASTRAEIQK